MKERIKDMEQNLVSEKQGLVNEFIRLEQSSCGDKLRSKMSNKYGQYEVCGDVDKKCVKEMKSLWKSFGKKKSLKGLPRYVDIRM